MKIHFPRFSENRIMAVSYCGVTLESDIKTNKELQEDYWRANAGDKCRSCKHHLIAAGYDVEKYEKTYKEAECSSYH